MVKEYSSTYNSKLFNFLKWCEQPLWEANDQSGLQQSIKVGHSWILRKNTVKLFSRSFHSNINTGAASTWRRASTSSWGCQSGTALIHSQSWQQKIFHHCLRKQLIDTKMRGHELINSTINNPPQQDLPQSPSMARHQLLIHQITSPVNTR